MKIAKIKSISCAWIILLTNELCNKQFLTEVQCFEHNIVNIYMTSSPHQQFLECIKYNGIMESIGRNLESLLLVVGIDFV